MKMPVLLLPIISLALSVPAIELNSLTEAQLMVPDETLVYKTVGGRDLHLSVFHPEEWEQTPSPALLAIHGGGWRNGEPRYFSPHCRYFSMRGIPAFALEYRLVDTTAGTPTIHNTLSDCDDAIAYLRNHAAELGIDPTRIAVMGDSAGGNLALMLGILCENPELAKNLSSEPLAAMPRIESVVSIYGVLDRLTWIERKFPSAALMLECYAGKSALEPEVGPELAVTPMDLAFEALPPTFIGVGTKDQLYESSRICSQRLQASFEDVQYEEYPGEGHGFFNRSGRPASQKLRADILGFLARP